MNWLGKKKPEFKVWIAVWCARSGRDTVDEQGLWRSPKGHGNSRVAADLGAGAGNGTHNLLQAELTTCRMECLGRDLEGEDSVQPLSEMFMEIVLQKRGWG